MRLCLSLSAVTAMCLALVACGDDASTPQGTTSGAGGAGGKGGEASAGGEDGTPGAKADGERCVADEECRGGLCLTEEITGWAGGYCSGLCEPALAPCDAGSTCMPQGTYSLCLKSCEGPAGCTASAQSCVDVSEDGSLLVCVGGCDDDDQCEVACDDDLGRCSAAEEVCDNEADDDEDTLQDCEERDCSEQEGCAARIAAACTEATDVSAGGTFTGTTADGTSLFASICSDFFTYPAGAGAREKVFKFVAPAKGALRVAARATAADVDFDWYIRKGCDDASTLLGCFIAFGDGIAPLERLVKAGDTYFIFIEGLGATDVEYALDVSFAEQVCGDGAVVGTEECDDGNAVANDACANNCVVNTEVVCASATPVTEDGTVGDASEGTRGFTGSCGGDGGELVYRYTPAASGVVTITATPEGTADVILYARTTCADAHSELDCADDLFDGAAAEAITLKVTEGEPIDIFVDSYSNASSGPFTLTITPRE